MDAKKTSNRRRLRRGCNKESTPEANLLSQSDLQIVEHLRSTVPQVESLSDQQIKHLRDTFVLFDKDQDGIITTDEINTIVTSMGRELTGTSLKQAMEPFDTDGSGTIEFTEFLSVMSHLLQEELSEDDLVEIFRILDQDGDGSISKSDLREVIRRIGSSLTVQDVDEMLDEADKDRDGQIAFEEFVKIITARS